MFCQAMLLMKLWQLNSEVEIMKIINEYILGDMRLVYILNSNNRAVMTVLPKEQPCNLLTQKNSAVYDDASLVHLHLSHHNVGIFSNSFKFGESVEKLHYKEQMCDKTDNGLEIVTVEEADEGYAVKHIVSFIDGQKGFEVKTEFINNSNNDLNIEYISSVSLDALSPYLNDHGSNDLLFHRFKAGWCMEGLHQQNTLTELGLERAWARSAESIKLSAVGSRPIREYHPYTALEDTKNGVIWGVYLAHNASWQMELSRLVDGVSMSIGLADSNTGLWSKKVKSGENFTSPKAIVSVALGSIAELSNRILSMRHSAIDKVCGNDMSIIYNEFVTTWGDPTEGRLLKMADILSKGKTKYLVMDAGWFTPRESAEKWSVGDWEVNFAAFPRGMKEYCNDVRKKGLIPGIWMEFEGCEVGAKTFAQEYDSMKLTKDGKVIIGSVINGRKESFFDFRKKEVIDYLDEKVIKFLKDNGFGYLKIDYNTSTGSGIDGEDSPGENLRVHMDCVRNYIKKIKQEIPDFVIENCASGGCRLEPSMMDITDMSSASDTHEGYEAAIVAANLHYLTPPRQNQIWCTLKPEYSKERFSFIISQGFLGRICWSGLIDELSEDQLQEMFNAEEFYEQVSSIIMRGNSYIYRTDKCSFYTPTGSQAVLRYSEIKDEALLVVNTFKNAKPIDLTLIGNYVVSKSLYPSDAKILDDKLSIRNCKDYVGNVFLLKKV